MGGLGAVCGGLDGKPGPEKEQYVQRRGIQPEEVTAEVRKVNLLSRGELKWMKESVDESLCSRRHCRPFA